MKCPHVTPMLIFNAAYTTSQDSMEKLFLIEEAYIHDAQQHHTKSNHLDSIKNMIFNVFLPFEEKTVLHK